MFLLYVRYQNDLLFICHISFVRMYFSHKISFWLNVVSAKCPLDLVCFGLLSFGHISFGVLSFQLIVFRPHVQSAKCLWAKYSFGHLFFDHLSSHPQWPTSPETTPRITVIIIIILAFTGKHSLLFQTGR